MILNVLQIPYQPECIRRMKDHVTKDRNVTYDTSFFPQMERGKANWMGNAVSNIQFRQLGTYPMRYTLL